MEKNSDLEWRIPSGNVCADMLGKYAILVHYQNIFKTFIEKCYETKNNDIFCENWKDVTDDLQMYVAKLLKCFNVFINSCMDKKFVDSHELYKTIMEFQAIIEEESCIHKYFSHVVAPNDLIQSRVTKASVMKTEILTTLKEFHEHKSKLSKEEENHENVITNNNANYIDNDQKTVDTSNKSSMMNANSSSSSSKESNDCPNTEICRKMLLVMMSAIIRVMGIYQTLLGCLCGDARGGVEDLRGVVRKRTYKYIKNK